MAAGGISYLFREEALARGDSGEWAIKPGDPEASLMLKRIVDQDDPMPPADHGEMLSEREVALLNRWIAEGAEWDQHWAYKAPILDEAVAEAASIDHFIEKRLVAEGLSFAPEQTRARLIRRMSLDLTGLLPSQADYREYAEGDLEAYADDLLARDAYGERWTSMWMDLARYADTRGYEKDSPRDAWPYRDYLIRSFNADKPYDQFIAEQLAGDLMPEGGMEQLIATAFHRNTQTNDEGGTDDEEFRIAAIIERNNTTWEVFQGTTMACVQCHSHPYDPIRHEDYYESFAFFNNTKDADDFDYPHLPVPDDPEAFGQAIELWREIIEQQNQLQQSASSLIERTSWQPVEITALNGSAELKQDPETKTISTVGTVPARSEYRVKFTVSGELSALRLEALLSDGLIGQANRGFELSQVQLFLHARDVETREISLIGAFSDYFRSDSNLQDVLKKNANGWNVYPRQYHPHGLVLVPEKVEASPDSAEFELVLHHKRNHVTSATTLRNFRLSYGTDADWQDYAESIDTSELAATKKALQKLKGAALPITLERPDPVARQTHFFARGNWMSPEQEVSPGVPDSLPDFEGSTRLDFAQWLGSEENPLTARVIANRLWFELFGRGIVASLGDFGTFGDKPSHPELLDYLALRLMHTHEWRLKSLLKEIVLSRTYQQAPESPPELRERDPDNALLARGPRTRLTAEMVRDQALQAAGLLSRKKFGPSVMPYQPDGVWQTVYSGRKWKVSEGEDQNRRALYTYWKRTSPYPSMISFDAPSREVCTIQRVDTNTPLQALVKLNDPVYFEAAKAFGTALSKRFDLREAIADLHFKLSAQVASESILDEFIAFYRQAKNDYEAEPESAIQVADSPQAAALTIVANVLLNMDTTLTK
jgi:hypothetical protein